LKDDDDKKEDIEFHEVGTLESGYILHMINKNREMLTSAPGAPVKEL